MPPPDTKRPTTGPPPGSFDACASTPTSVTSLVIVIPPANVTGPILMVAPFAASSSAA
jgi:hypothetical protein